MYQLHSKLGKIDAFEQKKKLHIMSNPYTQLYIELDIGLYHYSIASKINGTPQKCQIVKKTAVNCSTL